MKITSSFLPFALLNVGIPIALVATLPVTAEARFDDLPGGGRDGSESGGSGGGSGGGGFGSDSDSFGGGHTGSTSGTSSTTGPQPPSGYADTDGGFGGFGGASNDAGFGNTTQGAIQMQGDGAGHSHFHTEPYHNHNQGNIGHEHSGTIDTPRINQAPRGKAPAGNGLIVTSQTGGSTFSGATAGGSPEPSGVFTLGLLGLGILLRRSR